MLFLCLQSDSKSKAIAKWLQWFSLWGGSAIRSTHSLSLSLLETTQQQDTVQPSAHTHHYNKSLQEDSPFLWEHNWPYHDQWEQRVMGSFLEPLEEIKVSKDKSWTLSERLRKSSSIVWNLSSVRAHCSQPASLTNYKWTPALPLSSSWLLPLIFLLILLCLSGFIWLPLALIVFKCSVFLW